MFRLIACAAAVALSTTSVFANGACDAQSVIVRQAQQERLAGMSEKKATRAVTRSLKGDAAALKPAVPLLVAWVYTLPEAQMQDDASVAYKDVCLSQAAK